MMKINGLLLLVFSLFILTSCEEEEEVITFKNNAELNQVWLGEQSLKAVGGQAHSGERVGIIDSLHEFGFGLERKVDQIFKHSKLNKVVVKAWVNAANLDQKSSLVLSIGDIGKPPATWKNYILSEQVKEPNKWQQITAEYTLTPEDNENVQNKIFSTYFWNNSKKANVLVDDLEVEFYPEEQ